MNRLLPAYLVWYIQELLLSPPVSAAGSKQNKYMDLYSKYLVTIKPCSFRFKGMLLITNLGLVLTGGREHA